MRKHKHRCSHQWVRGGQLEVKQKNGKTYGLDRKTNLVFEVVNPEASHTELRTTSLKLEDFNED